MTPAELKDLIDRYISGNITDDEKHLVDDWYSSYADSPANDSAADNEQLKAEIYARLSGTIHHRSDKVRVIRLMRYAAIIAIAFVSITLLIRKKDLPSVISAKNSESFTSIQTKAGEIKKIALPDGSWVWLNAKSLLRIGDNFQNARQRRVYLDEGEAFFEVTKNPERPFFVKTPTITTRVLGTSFNVRSYSQLKQSSVTVCTGKVQVNDNKRQVALLTPNMRVNYYPANRNAKVVSSNGLSARAWTEGKLIFNEATFKELAFAVANTYGINLVSKNKATGNYRYNININTSRTLEETLRVICSVHQNHYRRNDDEVIIY
ncbi:FecR family protein [Mucilaginibacter litoreus]|uniref:FecR family protein n=1 Tax=Mucilaginibacter litoreus TaxID=1048221 RepID=A0ABW3AYL1_9SPHI